MVELHCYLENVFIAMNTGIVVYFESHKYCHGALNKIICKLERTGEGQDEEISDKLIPSGSLRSLSGYWS